MGSKSVEEIFVEAVRRVDPADRAAYLQQACGPDAALRTRVEALLRAHAELSVAALPAPDPMSATLECTVDQPTPAPATPGDPRRLTAMEGPGDSIGRYKLLQQIGEGGFGSVYMAEQTHPVRRRVALKVIKAGMDTRGVIARFEAERQALAMMDHPNIARVLDAGATEFGRPYFVMELVKGISITAFCDEQRLDTRKRLELFQDVCSAISHAHQKGIIHRDIKPSNVLVTLHADKPVVKVIDFGIAKATDGTLTDKTLFTQFNQFVGTPAYMSPEQAATSGLDIDTRSDIYSLGVLLYELLTGGPPFDAKTLVSGGYEEMRRMIRETEPPRPSARLSTAEGDLRQSLAKARQAEPDRLGRIVEADLDWIVMKAIEKDRSRRYETANAMAQDIQRFLTDEPVTATPPTARYRFGKFVRRNKTAFRIGAAVVVLLIAGTAVSTWQAIRATRAEALANDRSEQAARDAARATQAEKVAIERSEWAAKEALRATQAERLANERSEQAAREAERATKAERLATERLAQVAAERDAKDQARQKAQGLATFLQNVLVSPNPETNGRELRVVDLLDHAASLLDSELSTQPDQKATFQRALGGVYVALGLPKQGMPLLERSYDYWLKTVGSEHQNTLDVMTALSHAYDEVGRYADALALREKLLEVNKRQKGPEHPDVLWTMTHIASSYHQMQRLDDALKLREEVLALWKRTVGPEDPATLSAMHNLVQSYLTANRAEEALKLAEQVLELRRKLNGPRHPDTIRAMINLASAYQQTGHFNDATKRFEEAAALATPVLGPEHPLTLKISNALAGLYGAHGRLDDSIRINERLIDLYIKVKGADHEDTLGVQSNLAVAYARKDRLKDAIALDERTLAAMRRALPPTHPFFEITLEWMMVLYENGRRSKDSNPLADELLALRRKKYGDEDLRTLDTMQQVAFCRKNAGRLDEAVKMQQDLLVLRKKINGPGAESTLVAMNALASMDEAAGRKDDALKLRDEALTITRALRGPEHRDTAVALANASRLHLETNDQAGALKLREEAVPLFQKTFGPEDPETLAMISNLAISYGNVDRKEEAIKIEREVIPVLRRVLPADHLMVKNAIAHLVWLYQNTNQPELAAKVQDEFKTPERKD